MRVGRHSRLLRLTVAVVAFTAQICAAATIFVGPDEEITRISDAAKIAKDGDVVLIHEGEYRGDVAVWHQKDLTIRGLGGGAVLVAAGQSAEGKATWVIRDGSFRIDNIEFRGARAPDGNGAGIRFEAGSATISGCRFFDNQNGVLTSNASSAELVIIDSLFAEAPEQTEHPLPHLLYVGRIARLEITGSRFHQGHYGHLIKSRARENHIRYNLILDGPAGQAAYELEFPNGGEAYVVGNIIGQSANTRNPVIVAYGAEGNTWSKNALYLAHNTLISEGFAGAWFLRVWGESSAESVSVTGINNLTAGIGLFTLGAPGDFRGNFPLPPWSLDPETLGFTLSERSLVRRFASPPPEDELLLPTSEFDFPIGTRPLDPPPRWAPGALQGSY